SWLGAAGSPSMWSETYLPYIVMPTTNFTIRRTWWRTWRCAIGDFSTNWVFPEDAGSRASAIGQKCEQPQHLGTTRERLGMTLLPSSPWSCLFFIQACQRTNRAAKVAVSYFLLHFVSMSAGSASSLSICFRVQDSTRGPILRASS